MTYKRIVSFIAAMTMVSSSLSVLFAGAANVAYEISLNSDNMLLYMDFDGRTAQPQVGAVKENGTVTYSTGIKGEALYLDGSASYLDLYKSDNSSLLAGLDEFTVSYWSKTDGSPSWYFYTSPDDTTQTWPNEKYVAILDDATTITNERYNSQGIARAQTATASYTNGSWKHVAVVEKANEMQIYINGELADTESSSIDLTDMLGENPIAYLGKANWGTGEYATGAVDEYKVYSTALSEEEILEEYKRVADAMGTADFENIKDNPRVVFASYFNDATEVPSLGNAEVTGTVSFADSADGTKALKLDSSASYLQIFDADGKSPLAGKNQVAIAFKVKADSQTSWWMYSTPEGATPSWGTEKYLAALDSGTSLTVERYSNNGSRPENAWATTSTAWKDVVILANENRTELYINGRYVSGVDSEYTLEEILGDNPVTYIGYAPWGTGEYASGLIDNYEIYDTAPIVDLGDTTHLEEDLILPTSEIEGCIVEWISSDEDVITSEGKITRPKEGKISATLTQKITMGNICVYKDYNVAIYGSENPYDFGVDVSADKGVDIQDNMYGLFFEDISYSADGGLYAELVENRNFEQIWRDNTNTGTEGTYKKPEYGWSANGGTMAFPTSTDSSYNPLNDKNPTYLKFSGTKLSNEAYDGVYAKKGDVLNVSFWAKSDSFKGSISAGVGNSTVVVADAITDEWTKYTAKLTMSEDVRYTPFDIILSENGEIDIDMISCIPENSVYGIFRKDLAEKLKDLNPGFLRFPGGCIIEGYDLLNRYQWKNSVGPIEERIQNWTRWSGGAHFDYNQTLGIGYYEYLLLCEYLECEPIPVLNVGLSCEYNSPKEAVPVYASQVTGDAGVTVNGVTYSTEFYTYIQDALDLIEFCNGVDMNNEWVKLRVEMGHEEPFGLTMLGIGNEQWALSGNQWYERYEAFEDVIHTYYPDMKLIGTSGPDAEGTYFDGAWSWIRGEQAENENFTYAVDEHYYRSSEWFLANTKRYDSYDRGTKVFAGEYAANGSGNNTIYSAIAEAAFMTGLERNADVVYMASYAPLFCREGYECWAPNMIWFNDALSYGKPDYYVQSMYMNNNGDYTLKSEMNNIDSESYYHTVSYDAKTGDVIVKIVNPSESNATVNVDLSAVDEKYKLTGETKIITLTSENASDTNTSADTDTVVPVTTSMENTESITYEMPAMSFVVFRVKTQTKSDEEVTAPTPVPTLKPAEPTSAPTETEKPASTPTPAPTSTPDENEKTEKTGYVSVIKSVLGNPITGFDADGNMIYAGDPAPMVDGDTVYLYVGNDVASGSTYSMPRWLVYSSKDLVEWKYEGVAMEENPSTISWANSSTSAWASQAIEHNGKYYFYFCTTAKTEIADGHHCIGVAVADSPTGPFVDSGAPLVNGKALGIATGEEGWYNIDPTVWIDKDEDGNEHIYLNWGNTYNVTCELNADMVSVKDINGDSEITKDDFVTSEFVGFEQNPPTEDYREASWLYRRQDENGDYYGKYYMFFANGWRESYSYAITDDPMSGKWEYMGSFMPPNATSNTSHGGVFDFKGKTYYIYHNGSLPAGSGYRRVANIQEVVFNDDGSIDELTELSTGISGWSTSIISANGSYVGHEPFVNTKSDSDYPITKSLTATKADGYNTQWELEAGKADAERKDYISIQSVNKPGLYISEQNGGLVLTQDADGNQARKMTFITRDALNGDDDKVSFESVTKRGYYITVSNGGITLTNGTDKDSASFEFDNEKALITSVPSSDIPTEGLVNSGFEMDIWQAGSWAFTNPGNWYSETASYITRTTDDKNSGTYAVKMHNGTIGQRLTLEAGKTYLISAYVKGEGTGTGTLFLGDGETSFPASNVIATTDVSVTDSWQKVTLEYESTSTKEVVLCFATWDGTVVYVDDTDVSEKNLNVSIGDDYTVTQSITCHNSQGTYTVTADFKIDTKLTDTLVGFVAAYNSDGALISVEKNEISPAGINTENLNVELLLDSKETEDGAIIKVMLWKKDNMVPITEVAEREIINTVSGNFANPSSIALGEASVFGQSANVGLQYIMSLDVDKLLAPSYEMHNLTPPNNAERYGGWERKGANNWVSSSEDTFTLAGHSLGHWMSAAAAFYAQTGDKDVLDKLNYAVDMLDELQTTTGSSYIGGCSEDTFTKMFNGDSNWADGYWVPWYGIHKIYQGLLDAYYYTDNEIALKVVTKFADWAVDGTTNLSDSFMQQTLNVEYGGMNEIFALMYEITGEEKYLETARRFTHDAILNPLIAGTDELTGKHANTQIPKIVGAAELYEQDPQKYADYKTACINFWDYVVNNRSYAIGGNSIGEHFEAQGAESLGVKTCESCNTYNMMRLTEHLYSWTKDPKYMDYYENVLYNHILGQQDPDTGSKMYFVSLLQGHHRIYEVKEESWWCCTGTGMENPGRYTRCNFYENSNEMYMNLYMPSTYTWEEKGLTFKVETEYPVKNAVKVIVTDGSASAKLNFRAPSWINGNMSAYVNGEDLTTKAGNGYLSIEREWKKGDTIDITIPMDITVYESRIKGQIAYKYGPATLAADLGTVDGVSGVTEYVSNETVLDSVAQPVPYIVTNNVNTKSLVERTDDESLTFRIKAENSSDGSEITLKPFYEIHHSFYNVYWDVDKESGAYEKELNSLTVDKVQPDGQQDEIGHNLQSESSNNGSFTSGTDTYFWRDAYGSKDAYFSYTMKVDENTKYLLVRYWGADGDYGDYKRNFNIYVDDVLLANQTLNGDKSGQYDVFYEFTSQMLQGKESVTVKFKPENENCIAGGVLEIRTMTDKAKDYENGELINGDFESELLGEGSWAFPKKGGWYAETATLAEISNEDVYSGEYSVKISNATIGQRIGLEYGKTYVIKSYIKGNAGTTIDILLGDGSTTWPASSVLSSKTVELTGEWQEVVHEFNCEDNLEFVLCYSSWNDTVVYIDNVTVSESETVPELSAIIDPNEGFSAQNVFDANAGNPMMPGYIGDPFIFLDDDGTYYVYGTTDGYGTSETGDLANNAPYCVWYSKDLINWKCHTVRYEDGTFPKVSTTLWAPSVTKAADGKYYMAYIWEGYNCYIASAPSPLGPWTDLYDGEKLKGYTSETEYTEGLFDTDIVTLSDGRTYIVTMGPQVSGQNAVWLGMFKEDMSGLERFEEIYHTSVFEGPGLFEREGKYYLTFSNGSLGNGSYRVDYAMSDNLWDGYTPMGTILQRDDSLSINTTGHSNSICVDGEWYICYHRKTQVASGGRSASMEKMTFNEDGTIEPIAVTVNGDRPNIENTVNEENLSWGGVYVTASSRGTVTPLGTGIAWSPKYAVDRNNGTLWVAADTGAQWLKVDFGEVKEVGRVETFFEYHTVAYKYIIEYSKDGKTWETFADKMDNESLVSPQVDSMGEKVEARYIRISFDEGVNVQRNVPVGIFEMNIYENPA